MRDNTYLFTTGEFAKLNGVNKRTLHYYHDIHLFSPVYIDDNGYHYYSGLQSMELEMILILRKIGLSIDEIKTYRNSPGASSFQEVLTNKIQVIHKSMEQLIEAENFLQKKIDQLQKAISVKHGQIEELYLEEEKILLSDPMKGDFKEEDFAVASKFAMRLKNDFGLYDNFGSRIAVENLIKGSYEQYDAFFAYGKQKSKTYDAIRPAGTYLRTYCVGDWEMLKDVYKQLLQYSKEHELTLCDYAYEEGLNEMSLEKNGEYITMISVMYNKNLYH